MRLQAVFFDLDGTLMNTLEDLTLSINHMLANHGYPVRTQDEIRRYVGNGARELLVAALPSGMPDGEVDERLAEYKAYYAVHFLDNTAPYPGVMQALEALKSQDILLGVLSNKHDTATRNMVEKGFPAGLFAAVQGAVAGLPLKPDPAGLVSMAKTLGVQPDNAVYVGDMAGDIVTAHAAGMRGVGAAWGFRPRADLDEAGADLVLDKPEQMAQLAERVAGL